MSEELALTIPCRVDKPDRISPIHVYLGDDWSGPSASCRPDFRAKVKGVPAARTGWKCPYCGGIGLARKPVAEHMGLFPDKAASCRVLVEQDRRRRRQMKEGLF